MNKILLVEDDVSIVENLKEFLKQESYKIDVANGQQGAIRLLEDNVYDLALLDISLKDGNGFSVCSYINENNRIPVIFLTASGDEYSTVMGLELGAYDYISKPFRPRELSIRIKNVLKRAGKINTVMEFGDLKVDTIKAMVLKNGEEIFLSALEYRLLLVFISNHEVALSRNQLLDKLWDSTGEFVNDNTLTVYIKRLREKIEDDAQNPKYIKTIRGIGYKLDLN